MKINTLAYIHKLLLANSESDALAYRNAQDRLNKMEKFQLTIDKPDELEAYKSSVDKQTAYVDDCWEKLCAASGALYDFENQEW